MCMLAKIFPLILRPTLTIYHDRYKRAFFMKHQSLFDSQLVWTSNDTLFVIMYIILDKDLLKLRNSFFFVNHQNIQGNYLCHTFFFVRRLLKMKINKFYLQNNFKLIHVDLSSVNQTLINRCDSLSWSFLCFFVNTFISRMNQLPSHRLWFFQCFLMKIVCRIEI